MTQKEKDLLLKDLCSRLPYGVKVQTTYINKETKERKDIGTDILGTVEISLLIEGCEEHKPYLFPLSSMTVEQKNRFPSSYSFLEVLINDGVYFYENECVTLNDMITVIQWCYKNHFDIHGLIPKGLAIDATGKNIY